MRDSCVNEDAFDDDSLEFRMFEDDDVALLLVVFVADVAEDFLFLLDRSKLINKVGSRMFSAGSHVLSLRE